ncbi:MAG: cellulase family glycosylhydrolase [Patescibacteria group bacterium]|nr:cellulase family glycosylhydrolase [Patescibacteria group bacterium]
MRLKKYLLKFLLIISAAGVVVFLSFWAVDLFLRLVTPLPKITYGVTFSSAYSQQLGLDPKEVFQSIIDDLKVKKIRLPVYWDMVEKTPGQFDFGQTDALLDMAQEKNTQIILSLGYKVPRWPECFSPKWAANLNKKQSEDEILKLLDQEVEHFKNRPEIVAWQIENEPLLNFGICKMFSEDFLKQEVDLVRSRDNRPVVLTDSGELGTWVTALKFSDIMGSSLYRTVWNPILGYLDYPLPPLYYRLKAYLTKSIFAPHSQGIFISELQTEPWSPGKPLAQIPIGEQVKIFDINKFQNAVNFTARTTIKEQYLWGTEWWYWMKIHGHPEYWDYAQTLFK